ncbi:MAG: TolC family protein [Phycisphaeraceae bacterium]
MATALVGCQSYQPRPLELAAYRQAWQRRDVTDASVAAFAEQLEAREGVELEHFDPTDGLSLAEAEVVALWFNPDLRVARRRANVAEAGQREAGWWEDPELNVDALRVLESVSEPWILGGGVSLTVPLSGRLAVERDQAAARWDLARWEAAVAEWRLRVALREAWLHWSAQQRQAELLDRYVDRVGTIAEAAESLVEAGELSTVEARVLRLELARRRIEHRQVEAEVERLQLDLLATLGLVPDAPVKLEPALEVADVQPRGERRRAALLNHPELRRAEATYALAEQNLHREIRRQYPDLTIGPRYSHEEGQSRLGVGAGLPLPLWNRNRQGIAEAEAEREQARVEAEAAIEALTARLAQLEHRRREARTRREALRREVAPVAEAQMREVEQLIELGELEILLWQDALTRDLEVRQALLDAALDEALAASTLRELVQPRLSLPHRDTTRESSR